MGTAAMHRGGDSSSTLLAGNVGVGEQFLVRRAVLFLISICYFSAFASLHCQYPGLLGTNGVLPVDAYLRRVVVDGEGAQGGGGGAAAAVLSLGDKMSTLPTLVWLHESVGLTVDTMAEGIAILGAGLAATAAALALFTRGGGVASLWAGLFALYLSMFNVGQTFLSFQWDILLLEVGFLCVWLAPSIRPCSRQPPNPLSLWLLRFCMFKLMLMSGAVKIQADCPTWLGLTALRYHFATQPLPTPLAWYAHHAHPELLKVGVAVTLAVEGPMTLLLIAPLRSARHFGAYCQIAMQTAIMLTGNYTFFNLLTVALAVAHLDDAALRTFLFRRKPAAAAATDVLDGDGAGDSAMAAATATSTIEHEDLPADPVERRRKIEMLNPMSRGGGGGGVGGDDSVAAAPVSLPPPSTVARLSRGFPSVASKVVIVAVLINSAAMFRVEMSTVGAAGADASTTASSSASSPRLSTPQISLAVGVAEANTWLEVVVPAVLSYFWMCVLPAAAAVHAYREAARSHSWPVRMFRVAAVVVALVMAVAAFSVTARPMASIVPSRDGSRAFFAALPSLGASNDASLLRAASKLHVSSGYGLFRRMTGVGRGLNQVARPEIILQGSADGHTWEELEFRHKPGDPRSPPTWVAPHQPRLDWQMWFAALGSYRNNPWLLNLVVRLLQGHPEVLALMYEERWPSSWPSSPPPGGKGAGSGGGLGPPKFVRAQRYEYDFEPPQPPAANRGGAASGGEGVSGDLDGSNGRNESWWRRRYTDEYLPVVSLENASIKAYMTQQGWAWPGRYLERKAIPEESDSWQRWLRGWPYGAVAAALAGVAFATVLVGADALATRVLLEGFAAEVKAGLKDKLA